MIDNKIDYYFLGNMVGKGILNRKHLDDLFIYLLEMQEKCKKYTYGATWTDEVFARFILTGSVTQTQNMISRDKSKIILDKGTVASDTIFFRQCSDIEMTLLAKAIYYSKNRKMEFLKHQIDVILQNGEIDIYKEWMEYIKRENRTSRITDPKYFENI